ncbi:hypothetical protein FGO68_gene5470 [Halteria grandinella]|uniref:Uncharacterized protein n=1 Tax=Halteria grandinella TaxID=5974 RepID=A0A8J8SUS3_HALGN|nr:hypothetical protein FGO68_gene5470 [Halteria grandinella]
MHFKPFNTHLCTFLLSIRLSDYIINAQASTFSSLISTQSKRLLYSLLTIEKQLSIPLKSGLQGMLYIGVIFNLSQASLTARDLWTIKLSMKTLKSSPWNLADSYSRKTINSY